MTIGESRGESLPQGIDVEQPVKTGDFLIQLVMLNTNSTQTQSFKGMTNQYDPQLHEEASFIHQLYPGATYIRIKYLNRSKNRLSLKIRTTIAGQQFQIFIRGFGFDNLYRNLFARLDSQPDLQSHLRQQVS